MVGIASDMAELVFHGLAFVPPSLDAPEMVKATSLYRPAWIHGATSRLPMNAVAPIARDAPLVGSLTRSPETAIALQRLAFLHRDLASFRKTVRRSLAELDPEDTDRPADLASIALLPAAPIEIFRSSIALALFAFGPVCTGLLHPFAKRVRDAFAPRWSTFTSEVPGALPLDLRISATLGPRGRLLEEGIVFVGTSSLPWDASPVNTGTTLATAAHEASVHAAGEVLGERDIKASWALIERAALDGAERAYRKTSAENPYFAFRATLDDRGLAPHDASLARAVEERLLRRQGDG